MLLLLNPTAEFKGGTGKHKVEGKEEAKAARNNMLKRYMDLLLPQKKLFAYAILSSVILTLIGIVSTVFNKAIMDEVLPYGLKNLLIFSCNCLTRTEGRWGDYYARCRERGMPHGKALKALARKRLKVIYAIMRDRVPYAA